MSLAQATHDLTPFQGSSVWPSKTSLVAGWDSQGAPPQEEGSALGHRVRALGWVGSGSCLSCSLHLSITCHQKPGDMYLQGWGPSVPPPYSSRFCVFQVYWPPLPGQTEECFRKGKDPGVSLALCVLCHELSVPVFWLCYGILLGMPPWGS